jgi:DNA-directed RNA polymerase subunit RPC12/RpoP
MVISTEPLIKCSTCGVEFTAQAITQHLQEHPDHQAGPLIKCSTCGVEFTSPDQWKEHLKEHAMNKAL